jgi:hypothetical protein
MPVITRAVISLLLGLLIGGTVVLLLAFVTLMLAMFAHADVQIPGIVHAWSTREKGLPALDFVPDAVGMTIAASAIAVVYAATATVVGIRRRRDETS